MYVRRVQDALWSNTKIKLERASLHMTEKKISSQQEALSRHKLTDPDG